MRHTLVTCLLSVLLLGSLPAEGKRKVAFEPYCIVLVTSTECGYCLINTDFFNSLAADYAGQIQMIALNESSRKQIEALPGKYPGHQVKLTGWTIVPSARKIYMPLVERETFPQILLLENGKVRERFVGTIPSVKEAIRKAIPPFIKKKQQAASDK